MPDITKRVEKADKLLQRGKLDLALEEYNAALAEDPGNEEVREKVADLCLTLNRERDAASLLVGIFEHAIGSGDQAKAVATYKKLARVSVPTTDQTFRFAQLIESTNKHEALEAYENAIQGFTKAGKKPEAYAAAKRVVALEVTEQNLRREGELAADLGKKKEAAAAFLAAGNVAQDAGGYAFSWYERAHQLDSTNVKAVGAYGRALLAKGDAAKAAEILSPFAHSPDNVELRDTYARALLAAKRIADAIPFAWELFERDPKEIGQIVSIISSMLDSGQSSKALELTRKLEQHEAKAGRRREFVSLVKDLSQKRQQDTEFLEYLAELFDANSREHDFCETLLKLFDLYCAAGNFSKAGECLDRAGEVDAYQTGNDKRLEILRGKIDARRFNAIAGRFSSGMKVEEPQEEAAPEEDFEKQGTMLEDLMLQAEIFLQYSMRSKAVERLQRIQKLFPDEGARNKKLRQLYLNAGITFESGASVVAPAEVAESVPTPEAPTLSEPESAEPAPPPSSPPPTVTRRERIPQALANENAVDNISRVTEITRDIYRQGSVKGVLFASVNDLGKHWDASRCIAGLCTPGKPPSAALEYCAPGIKQSEVMAIVKLLMTLQAISVQRGPISVNNAMGAPELARVHSELLALDIASILAVPLTDGDQHVGLLILEQCSTPRTWRQTDVVVLKTIADQIVLAVNNAKLRSLVKTLAVTDEKSGLLKRSSYLDVLLSEVKRALQQESTVTVMLIHFGKASALVREAGEQAVETMMQEIGQVVCSQIRQNDVAVRYELTTLALILSDTTEKNAFFVVDKLRKVLASVRIPGRARPTPMTVGIAEAVMQQRFDAADIVTEVINRAEAALEAARAAGGNKAQSLAPTLEATSATAD